MSITGIGTRAGWAGYVAPASRAPAQASGPPASSANDAVEKEFLDYAKMPPAEKIRYAYLRAHNLSEDDLKAMSAEQRESIETAIREEIRRAVAASVERKSGYFADIRA